MKIDALTAALLVLIVGVVGSAFSFSRNADEVPPSDLQQGMLIQ